MRVVVVGAGVVGLLTAMECACAGARVDLVDRDDIPSPQATSYDRQRVVRVLHRDDMALTAAAARGQQGWLHIERRLGTQFYHRSGSLTVMSPAAAAASRAQLAAVGTPSVALSPAELAARYPQIRFPAGLAGVLEPAAGTILADRALTALAGWLRHQPSVRLHPHRPVTGFDTAAVRLADGGTLAADRVVVAAGPWSRDLLPAALGRSLRLYRQSMLACVPTPAMLSWSGLPAIPRFGNSQGSWLIPPVAGAPARLSSGSSARVTPELSDHVTPARWRNQLISQFAALVPDFDPAAVVGAADGYYLADAASGGPLLATFGDGLILAYAACGGMTFKVAPPVARALADRAVGRPPRPTGLDPIDRPRQLDSAGDQPGLMAGGARRPAAGRGQYRSMEATG